VIKSFKHKGLAELWNDGSTRRIATEMQKRVMRRLVTLHRAAKLSDMNEPGFKLHLLKQAGRYSISVNGPWRITFEWLGTDAHAVDLEQYH
jgi:proteic killer suppression protein